MLLASDQGVTNKVEVLDPPPPDSSGGSVEVLALIAQYTARPDLFLEVVEKYDPGFIRRMNQSAEEGAAEFRKARFSFGRFQAYTTLLVSVAAALFVLWLMYMALVLGNLNFWIIIAFAVFYAVAQGGRNGFVEVAKGLAGLLNKKSKDNPKE